MPVSVPSRPRNPACCTVQTCSGRGGGCAAGTELDKPAARRGAHLCVEVHPGLAVEVGVAHNGRPGAGEGEHGQGHRDGQVDADLATASIKQGRNSQVTTLQDGGNVPPVRRSALHHRVPRPQRHHRHTHKTQHVLQRLQLGHTGRAAADGRRTLVADLVVLQAANGYTTPQAQARTHVAPHTHSHPTSHAHILCTHTRTQPRTL
jgi:hypothetical protein